MWYVLNFTGTWLSGLFDTNLIVWTGMVVRGVILGTAYAAKCPTHQANSITRNPSQPHWYQSSSSWREKLYLNVLPKDPIVLPVIKLTPSWWPSHQNLSLMHFKLLGHDMPSLVGKITHASWKVQTFVSTWPIYLKKTCTLIHLHQWLYLVMTNSKYIDYAFKKASV